MNRTTPMTEGRQADAGRPFGVHDAATANWVVRKVVECRDYAARAKAWAAAEQRRAERRETFLLARFGPDLEAWARGQVAAQADGRRSVSLPGGTVGFRAAPRRLTVTDEARALAWCRHHLAEAVRVAETVARAALAAHVKATGECPDGVDLTGGDDRFFIQAKPAPPADPSDSEKTPGAGV